MSKRTTKRLVCHVNLLLLLSLAMGMGGLPAQGSPVDGCAVAEPLTLNATLRRTREASRAPDFFWAPLSGPGILSLDVSSPGRRRGQPRLSVLEGGCTGGIATDVDLIRETPRGLVLRVGEPRAVYFAVSPDDPATPLANYKLRVAFAEEPATPDVVMALDVNPPASCSASGVPPLGADPYQANSFVVLEREIDLTEDVEPEDCDILEGAFAAPGVVVFEVLGSPLRSTLFAGSGCAPRDRLAEGLLDTPDAVVAAPVHPGMHRLALEPLDAGPVAYMLSIKHFALCELGERDDHGDTPLCASPLDAGVVADGVIGNITGDDEDFFTFVLDSQQTVALQVAGAVSGGLYNAQGQQLEARNANRLSKPQGIVRTLGPGRYYVRISDAKAFVHYTIALREIGALKPLERPAREARVP